jgi:hypothetical protein
MRNVLVSRCLAVVVGAAVLATATLASAILVDGGGSVRGLCFAGFEVKGGKAGSRSNQVTCTDGSSDCDFSRPACSLDRICVFQVRYCTDEPSLGPACTFPSWLVSVKSPQLGSLGPTSGQVCTPFTNIIVTLHKKGKNSVKKHLSLTAKAAGGKVRVYQGKLELVCLPRLDTCVTTTTTSTSTSSTSVTLATTSTSTTVPGSGCTKNPTGGPSEFDLMVEPTPGGGSELDNGTTGTSHNFAIPQGSTLSFCLSGCSASNPMCQATGATGQPVAGTTVGKGGVNGTTFGAPLPLFAAGVPVCVINRYQQPTLNASYDVSTGAFSMQSSPLLLFSDVYLSSNPSDVCPRCTGGGNQLGAKGTCDSGANQGQSCTVGGTVVVNNPPAVKNDFYALSNDCLPPGADKQATLNITLPLTTGTSTLAGNAAGNFPCPGQTVHDSCNLAGGVCNFDCSAKTALKGGINQFCCSGDQSTPCFPTSPQSGIGKIERDGTPAPIPGPYPASTQSGTLVATFCEAATHSNVIDTSTGLPGPGALILRGTQTLLP